MNDELEMARAVAPEDIQPGEYVTALHVVWECIPFPWDGSDGNSRPARILMLPENGSTPVQVLEVCLPLVLVKTPYGKRGLIDVRKYRLARVSEQFGRRVFEEIEAQQQAENKNAEKAGPGNEEKETQ
ncbi:MAG TPA: hypothetical protein VMV94_06835 [Phycisphaerae bacterium]|nr:hypothetical protein [Phycisphaerae bacterium]